MRYFFLGPIALISLAGACSSGSHRAWQPADRLIALEDGARLSYRSLRRSSDPVGDRRLAVRARQVFCSHHAGFVCDSRDILFVSIVSNANVPCTILASGRKHRAGNPQDQVNAEAEFDCVAAGQPETYREHHFALGTTAIPLDGQAAWVRSSGPPTRPPVPIRPH